MNVASYAIRVIVGGCFTIMNIAALFLHEKISGCDIFFRYAKRWARITLRCAGTQMKVITKTEASDNNSYIYVCNHISLLDAPALIAALPEGVRFMYKQEIERVPLFGGMLKKSPFIAVNRGNLRDANASFYQAAKEIASGGSVLIFPEGTWSNNGSLLPFKRGALLLALRSGKPIVPIAIWGTQFVLPPEQYRFRGGNIVVCIGKPICFTDNSANNLERDTTETLRLQIAALLEECRNQTHWL